MPNKKIKLREEENQIYFLVQMRRRIARQSMDSILSSLSVSSSKTPDLFLLINYITNMTSCIELMLKLLSDNWSNHNVAFMYKEVFGHDYQNTSFMDILENTICDQKYRVSPVHGIEKYIPDLENIFDQLQDKLSREPRSSGEYRSMKHVGFTVALQTDVCEYLRHNVGRFHIHPVDCSQDGSDYCMQLESEVDRISGHLQDLLDWNAKFVLRFDTFSIPWLE